MKCQNINRGPPKSEPSAKHPQITKNATTYSHAYPTLSAAIDDDVSHERHVTKLKQEVLKVKGNIEVMKDLMERTYGMRHKWILSDVKPVTEICDEYPLLQKANFVSYLSTHLIEVKCQPLVLIPL